MTRARYTFDAESGLLVDRDGEPLGRVVSLTIELPPGGGRGGAFDVEPSGVEDSKETTPRGGVGGSQRPTATQLEREAIQRCWSYWLQLTDLKQKLDAKRTRILRNAIHLVGEQRVTQALYGLSVSPHHNGQNEQRRKYLEIRYALKGIGDESDEERIAKAIGWGKEYGGASSSERSVTAIEERMREAGLNVERGWRLLEDVRQAKRGVEVERGRVAQQRLEDYGFTILSVDTAPYARLSW